MIQVLDRAFDILELLGSFPDENRPLSYIAEKVNLKKTTCSNILKTLLEREYVEQTKGSRNYKLGFKAYKLVGAPKFYERLTLIASDAMKILNNATAETVVLAIIDGGKRVVVSNIELSSGITARINHSNTIFRTATGRVILAWYPKVKLDHTIERIGLPDIADWPEVTSKQELYDALAKIREDGYCETGKHNDIVGIAVPLFKEGKVIASIGVCLPEFRYFGDKERTIRRALSTAADSINSELAKGVM